MKDKFAFFEGYKNPVPKRRQLLAKRPFLYAKRALFKNPFKLAWVSFSTPDSFRVFETVCSETLCGLSLTNESLRAATASWAAAGPAPAPGAVGRKAPAANNTWNFPCFSSIAQLQGAERFSKQGSTPTLESAKIPFTLRMAKTKTMVLVFGFSFPFSAGFQGKSGFSFGRKWFYFLVSVLPQRRGWGLFASFEYYPLGTGSPRPSPK